VIDELLTRLPPLVRVPLASEHESLPHLVEVHRLDRVDGMLGDDGEEVRQELALVRQ
jgi:hypothetical protein